MFIKTFAAAAAGPNTGNTAAEDDFHQCLADLALPRRVIEALG